MKLFSLRLWRVLLPLSVALAVAVLLWRYQYPLPPDAVGLLWLSRLDPLLLLAEWRAEKAIPGWAWLPLIVTAVTLLFGRLFCGWLCPLGALLAQIPNRLGRIPVPAWFAENRMYWLVFCLALLLFGSNWPLLLTPFHLLSEEFVRLWQGKMPWLMAAVLLSGVLFFPRFWCTYMCPTGLLLAVISRWRPFRLKIADGCLDCGLCGGVCRTRAVQPRERRVAEDCMLCGRCWQACPAGAINWRDADVPRSVPAWVLSRRQLVKGAVTVAAAGAGWQALGRSAAAAVIRPPGALPEADFVDRCSRCGRCVKVCPPECLFPMPLEAGFAAFLTPRVIPRQARCELCMLCQEVCPTGAIGRVPLAQVKMGTAEIDRTQCLVWGDGRKCLLCREQCPVHAIEVDEKKRPVVDDNVCVGCGACENGCPLSEAAITVKPIQQERGR